MKVFGGFGPTFMLHRLNHKPVSVYEANRVSKCICAFLISTSGYLGSQTVKKKIYINKDELHFTTNPDHDEEIYILSH